MARGVKHALAHHQALSNVRLNGTRITDKSCGILAALPKIESIDLANTAVTTVGLRRICQKHLDSLDLSGTAIDDEVY